ncbi:hypothetical protein BOW22_09665 [Solemya velum gill symbiont]|nr:hypothetical protein BOW21_09745 [Solemya velum gill symbiont]OOZ04814.1 hypothetical protein BOW22_09665 [Solemya velum gill symbiont]OOZ07055.1 hypothetical protein BOW23_09670 [Solemya velum gill symbiont]OOZ09511.1 hypothetical protein BOW24_09685 [Solemya velum gill symbiont]OOZ13532.1 hypothetical protein BOW25_04735 [Solemya velum gill symbiont]
MEKKMKTIQYLVFLVAVLWSASAWSQNLAGEYNIKVTGSNVHLHKSPAQSSVNANTTLKITQNGSRITMTFGGFGGVSAATIFKGDVGNNRFSAVWWYKGYPHETKVVWGTVNGNKIKGRMIYPRVSGRQGLVPGWVDVSFSGNKKLVINPGVIGGIKPVVPVIPVTPIKPVKPVIPVIPGLAPVLAEDCLSFNPDKVKVEDEGDGTYLLTDGHSRMKVFPNKKEARRAKKVIRHYRLNKHCFIGRPGPSLEYWLKGSKAPKGGLKHDDCIKFNPSNLTLKKEGSRWLLRDGSHRMHMFPNKKEANTALAFIKKYGFKRTCYIGRPDPSMTYFRK